MVSSFLEFEKPIAEIDAKIGELRRVNEATGVDLSHEIKRLELQSTKLTENIFSSLTPWQITQLARHPMRPYTMDYIERLFNDFEEIHGDRVYAEDAAIVCGLAKLNGHGVAVIGHQKGRNTQSKLVRNFGMPKPEGYRKAQRIVNLAAKFRVPVLTFIDTPGAYPGIDAEERGQSEAIASSLMAFVRARCPIIATVIGEGGSGGALAIGIADYLVMLEYSTYSVISPEGCASILWKDSTKAEDAASVMGLTSNALLNNKLIDQVVREPVGGAHRDYGMMATDLKGVLISALDKLRNIDIDELLEKRNRRLMSYGEFQKINQP